MFERVCENRDSKILEKMNQKSKTRSVDFNYIFWHGEEKINFPNCE